jgi:CAAX protease family protein
MTTVQPAATGQLPTSSAERPLRTRMVFTGELGAPIALTVADAWGLVPFSRTPFLLLFCRVSLRLRRLAWRDIGLSRPPRMKRAIALGIVTGLAIELFAINFTTPWIAAMTGAPPDVSDFRIVVGNVQLLLIFVVVNWILAAFGEELAFRGYLMNRFGNAFGGTPVAWVASLVMVSVYFGIGHGTQGLAGIVQESVWILAGRVLPSEQSQPDHTHRGSRRVEHSCVRLDLLQPISRALVSTGPRRVSPCMLLLRVCYVDRSGAG